MLAFVVVSLLALYAFNYRRVIRYRLRERSLHICWLGIPVVRVPYDDVGKVELISLSESMKYGMRTRRMGNRLKGPVVAIRRRSGWVRDVLITPDCPEAFVEELKRKLPHFNV